MTGNNKNNPSSQKKDEVLLNVSEITDSKNISSLNLAEDDQEGNADVYLFKALANTQKVNMDKSNEKLEPNAGDHFLLPSKSVPRGIKADKKIKKKFVYNEEGYRINNKKDRVLVLDKQGNPIPNATKKKELERLEKERLEKEQQQQQQEEEEEEENNDGEQEEGHVSNDHPVINQQEEEHQQQQIAPKRAIHFQDEKNPNETNAGEFEKTMNELLKKQNEENKAQESMEDLEREIPINGQDNPETIYVEEEYPGELQEADEQPQENIQVNDQTQYEQQEEVQEQPQQQYHQQPQQQYQKQSFVNDDPQTLQMKRVLIEKLKENGITDAQMSDLFNDLKFRYQQSEADKRKKRKLSNFKKTLKLGAICIPVAAKKLSKGSIVLTGQGAKFQQVLMDKIDDETALGLLGNWNGVSNEGGVPTNLVGKVGANFGSIMENPLLNILWSIGEACFECHTANTSENKNQESPKKSKTPDSIQNKARSSRHTNYYPMQQNSMPPNNYNYYQQYYPQPPPQPQFSYAPTGYSNSPHYGASMGYHQQQQQFQQPNPFPSYPYNNNQYYYPVPVNQNNNQAPLPPIYENQNPQYRQQNRYVSSKIPTPQTGKKVNKKRQENKYDYIPPNKLK